MTMAPGIPEVEIKKSNNCLQRLAKALGHLLLAAVVLVVASPVLLVLLVAFGLLIGNCLVALGCALGLAAIAAYLLHDLLGFPFWFWMIFTGLGTLLPLAAMLTSAENDGAKLTGNSPQSACSPLSWLLTGLLLTHWWGGHGNG